MAGKIGMAIRGGALLALLGGCVMPATYTLPGEDGGAPVVQPSRPAALPDTVGFAAVVAREVAIWTGAILSRRGRKLKARNAEARAAYEREAAERRAATGY